MNGRLTFDSANIEGQDVHRARYVLDWLLIEAKGESRQQACSKMAMVLRGMHQAHPAHADSRRIVMLVNLNDHGIEMFLDRQARQS